MKTALATPAVADAHWATPPERDPRGYLRPALRGVLGEGHTRDAPCPGCLRLGELLRVAHEQIRVTRKEITSARALNTSLKRALRAKGVTLPRAKAAASQAIEQMPVRKVILLAAFELDSNGIDRISVHDLVVRAHQISPRRLSLRGSIDHKHPDSHLVVSKLCGKSGLCGPTYRWLRRVAPSVFELTGAGRATARALVAKHAAEGERR